jgi:hypothetical protein
MTPSMLVSKRVNLTWCGKVSVTEGGVGAGAYNFYRLNGAYDPDSSGVGNALPGLASMATLFRSMRVWKTTFEFDGASYSGAASGVNFQPVMSFVPTSFQPVLPANPDYWPVQRMAKDIKMIAPVNYASTQVGAMYRGKATFEPHVVANITKSQYADESDYSSTTSSTPTRQLYVAVCMSSNCNVVCLFGGLVRVSYEIEFFDPWPLV